MAEADLPRGTVPPGTYARGGRSPVVYAFLCPSCAGYAPTVPDTDYLPLADKHCQGCGAYVRETHRFQALIMSAANGGCACTTEHPQVTGDLPTEESALAVWTEVKTRPAPRGDVPEVKTRPAPRGDVPEVEVIPDGGGWQVRCAVHGYLGAPAGWAYEDHGMARMVATRHRNRHVRGEDD